MPPARHPSRFHWLRAGLTAAGLWLGAAWAGASEPVAVPGRGDGWRVIGPGGGGAMFAPTISPHDGKLFFLACDMTGSYVSRDAGASWRMFNLQEVVRGFAFDARNPDTIYAYGSSLWVSRDRGHAWVKILPVSGETGDSVATGDHADLRQFTPDGRLYRVTALAADPAVPDAAYAAVQVGEEHRLLATRDGGRTWMCRATLPRRPLALIIDSDSPAAARTLIVAHTGGLTVCAGGEQDERSAPAGVEIASVAAARAAAGKGEAIYAVTAGEQSGVWLTWDQGGHWTDLTPNVTAPFPQTRRAAFRAVAVPAGNPAAVYLSFQGLVGADGQPRLGVARSDDAGRTWRFPWLDPLRPGTTGGGSAGAIPGWVDENFGPDWGENPLALTVDPHDPAQALATDFGRALRTTDGGRSWQPVYTTAKAPGAWVSRGLDVTNAYELCFDPFDARHVFMACTDVGLIRSRDGGESWCPATPAPGLPAGWLNTTYALRFDPAVRGRVWAAMSSTHDLPREKMWRKRAPAAFDGGIVFSDDGGEHWQTAKLAVGEAAVTDLLLDPASPVAQRTLYACAFGRGVLKSIDGGKTWTLKNRGLAGAEPLAWRVYRRASDHALFLVVFRRSDAAEGAGAVYRSDDGAESWHPLALPEDVNAPTSLAVEDLSAGALLVSAWGRPSGRLAEGDQHGGIYRSTDDGKSWTPVLVADAHIATLSLDPRTRVHYACGFNGQAYRSTDEGWQWRVIPGYDFKWGQRVVPDPQDSTRIYIMTYGGGVWHGPAGPDAPATK